MKKVLIVFDSKTGKTKQMAGDIAEGISKKGCETAVRGIDEIKTETELQGFDAYLFGCPTYFEQITDEMKSFLFMAKRADLAGKIGGSFGSYGYLGNAPKIIHRTMEYIFGMDMVTMGELNVKEQMVDKNEGREACQAYGQAMGDKIIAS